MVKTLALLGLLLAASPVSRGAENILALLKGNCSVDDVKRQLDVTAPGDVNRLTDEDGRTALFFSRHLGTALLLLAGADPNLRDHDGRTPAFRAVGSSRDPAFPIMLELLALAHTDVNAQDADHYTLLAWAAHEGNLPAVKFILMLGANPAPREVPGNRQPVFFALQAHDEKMAAALQGGRPAHDQTLAEAAEAAHLNTLSSAIGAVENVDAVDKDGATALYRAVSDRRAEVVALLLLGGANPNLANNLGRTPLMQCVCGYDTAAERTFVDLLVAGADVNATARDGTTPLSQAVHSRNNTAAQWLIWRGANLDVNSPDGSLMQGASLNADWPSMIELLKRAGLKEEQSPLTKVKGFALFEAVKAGNIAAVEAELANGTPADVTNRYDQTPLEWAVTYDQFGIVDLLLRHGANINHQHGYNGEHLLHRMGGWTEAISANAPHLMEEMLKRGADPNLLMKDGCTPLMVAARQGVTGRSLELLLQVTRDVNIRDKQGLTALALARQHGYGQVAKILVEHGAVE